MKKLYPLITILILFFLYSCGSVNYGPIDSRSVIEKSKKNQMDGRIVVFKVTGKGMGPENAVRIGEEILLGERAAVLDGYRLLVEKLEGVLIETYSKRDGVEIDMDVITSQAKSYLRGVEILETKHGQNGIYSVDMQVRVYFTYNELIWWPSGLGSEVTPFPHRKVYYATRFSNGAVRCVSYPWCGQYYYHGGP